MFVTVIFKVPTEFGKSVVKIQSWKSSTVNVGDDRWNCRRRNTISMS